MTSDGASAPMPFGYGFWRMLARRVAHGRHHGIGFVLVDGPEPVGGVDPLQVAEERRAVGARRLDPGDLERDAPVRRHGGRREAVGDRRQILVRHEVVDLGGRRAEADVREVERDVARALAPVQEDHGALAGLIQRLGPDGLQEIGARPHGEACEPERVLVDRDDLRVRQDGRNPGGHVPHVVAGDERRRRDGPQAEMRLVLDRVQPGGAHLEHVGVVPAVGRAVGRRRGPASRLRETG